MIQGPTAPIDGNTAYLNYFVSNFKQKQKESTLHYLSCNMILKMILINLQFKFTIKFKWLFKL